MVLGLVVLLAILQSEPLSPTGPGERSQFSREVASEIVVPIFLGSGEGPAAVVKVERATRDLQRRGFFRIGSLPIVRLENVRVELHNAAVVTDALEAVPSVLRAVYRKGAFEVKGFKLAGEDLAIAARSVDFSNERQLRLEKVVVRHREREQSADFGIWHVGGERRGALVLSTAEGEWEVINFQTLEAK